VVDHHPKFLASGTGPAGRGRAQLAIDRESRRPALLERTHVGPDLLDVIEALFLRADKTGGLPSSRQLAVRGPDRVLLFVVDHHPKFLAALARPFAGCDNLPKSENGNDSDERYSTHGGLLSVRGTGEGASVTLKKGDRHLFGKRRETRRGIGYLNRSRQSACLLNLLI